MPQHAETQVFIPASPERVWAVLTQTERWSAWNPSQPWLRCPLTEGARGHIAVRIGPWVLPAGIRMVTVVPNEALCWEGGVRGLFYARHGFFLSAEPSGTRVFHRETFHGVVAWLLGQWLIRRLHASYQRTNTGLHDGVMSQT